MRLICCTLLFITSATTLFGQTWQWDTLVQEPESIRLYKNVDNTMFSFAEDSSVVKKIDGNGSVLWQYVLPANARISSVASATDQSFYFVGTFTDTLTLSIFSVISRGSSDVFLAKFDISGNVLWLKSAGSKGEETVGEVCTDGKNVSITGIAADSIFFSGQLFPKLQNPDLFVARYTIAGALVNVRIATGLMDNNWCGVSQGCEIETDHAGNILIAGTLFGTFQFDTLTTDLYGWSGNYPGYFIMKLDSALGVQWIRKCGTSERVHSLRINSSDEIIFIEHVSAHYANYSMIKKVATSGTPVFSYYPQQSPYSWSQNLQYNLFFSRIGDLQLDSCDNIYFTGGMELTSHSAIPPAIRSLLVGQLSSTGNLNWHRVDSSYNYRWGCQIAPLGPNHCYVAGIFYDTLQLVNAYVGTDTVPYYDSNFLRGSFQARIITVVGTPVNSTPATNMYLCAGSTTTLQTSSTGNITWYSSPTSLSAIGSGPTFTTPGLAVGLYTYYAEASSCTMTTGRLPVTVTVNTNPTVTVVNGIVCKPGSFTINPTGAPNFIYSSGSAVVSPSVTTSYSVTGISAEGCTNSAVCEVSVMPSLQPTINTSINFMCYGQTAILTVIGATTYTWNTGEINQPLAVSPTIHTNYSVEVSNENGCKGSAIITQYVAECLSLSAHSAGQPNIYPIPCREHFYADVNTDTDFLITNAAGTIIYRGLLRAGTNRIDLDISGGLYFLIINGSRSVHKVIVE